MGNEMGNSNVTGLQASEQEINESSNPINEFPKNSLVSTDRDGLKDVASYPNPQEGQDPQGMAIDRSSKQLVTSNDANGSGTLILINTSDDFHEVDTDLAPDESINTNGVLIQIEADEGREEEEMRTSICSTLETNVVAPHLPADLVHNEMQNEQENIVTTSCESNADNEPTGESNREGQSSNINILKSDAKGDTEDFPVKESGSSKQLITSNDANGSGLLILLNKSEDFQAVDTDLAPDELVSTNGVLIQIEADEGREEEEMRTSICSTSETNVIAPHLPADLVHNEMQNEQENIVTTSCESNAENEPTGESNREGQSSNINILKSEAKGDTEDFPVKESGSFGEMQNEVLERNTGKHEAEQCQELDQVAKYLITSERENIHSDEPGSTTYLDTIDSEIKRLIMEDDTNLSIDASKTGQDEFEEGLNVAPAEQLKMDEIESDSFEIQLKLTEPFEKEKEERENAELEDNVFELAIQTVEVNEIESMSEEQHDYNSNMMSDEENRGLDCKIREMEKADGENTTSVMEISVADNVHEEIKKEEREQLQNDELSSESLSKSFFSLSSPAVVEDVSLLIETKHMNANQECGKDCICEVKQLEANENSGERFPMIPSHFLDSVCNITENKEEKPEDSSEQQQGELDDQTNVQPDDTKYLELEGQSISVETAVIASPRSESYNFSLNCSQEFEQTDIDDISVVLADKEVFTSVLDQMVLSTTTGNESLSICTELPILSDEVSFVAFESPNQLMTRSKGEECNLLSDPEELESSQGLTSKQNQQKIEAHDEKIAGAPQPAKDNSEINALLHSKESLTCPVYELVVRTESSKQDPSVGHDNSSKAKAFPMEVSEPEEHVNVCHISIDQEVVASEESDKSPLLPDREPTEIHVSEPERRESEKLRAPLLNFLKDKVDVVESMEKKEGNDLNSTVEVMWQSPARKYIATDSQGRQKQKPRSSIFGNCMCCTTAIN